MTNINANATAANLPSPIIPPRRPAGTSTGAVAPPISPVTVPTPTGSPSGAIAPLSSPNVFSEGSSSLPSFPRAQEDHPNDTSIVNKAKLGKLQIAAKVQRFNLIDATITHALATATLTALPSENSNVSVAVEDLLATNIGQSDNDIESQADGLAEARAGLDEIKKKARAAVAALNKADSAKTNFMDWKGRVAGDDGTTTTKTEKVQRHIFGKERHAVFLRSLAQSLVVVGIASGMQVATTAIMKDYFANNPDAIPDEVLSDARDTLGDGATNQEVTDLAIDELSKAGATYVDPNTSPPAVVFGSEAGVGFMRGVIVPVADSHNEQAKRSEKIDSAARAVDGNLTAPEPPNASERARAAFKRSIGPQMRANMASAQLAAAIGLVAGDSKPGFLAAIDIGKSLGFGAAAAASNASADAFRAAVYTGDDETKSQLLKVGGRVVGRAVSQVAKEGMSAGQSLAQGTYGTRSTEGDLIKALGIQVGVSGVAKEMVGALVQRITSAQLPPNEKSVLASADALVAMKELLYELVAPNAPGVGFLTQDTKDTLIREFSGALAGAYQANSIKFEEEGFDDAHSAYLHERNPVPADENV